MRGKSEASAYSDSESAGEEKREVLERSSMQERSWGGESERERKVKSSDSASTPGFSGVLLTRRGEPQAFRLLCEISA